MGNSSTQLRVPFTGEHELTVDAKNRLLVPSMVRSLIIPERDGNGLVLKVGGNLKIWLYPVNAYYQLLQHIRPGPVPDPKLRTFQVAHFAHAYPAEIDGQGRILLPEKLLKRSNTGSKVVLVGMDDHLELWNREDWEVESNHVFGRLSEIERDFCDFNDRQQALTRLSGEARTPPSAVG